MKLRLAVSRKGGAPNYGSDGVSAELELDVELENAQQLLDAAMIHYKTLETAVDRQLAEMQAKHPAPGPAALPRSQDPERHAELRQQAAQQQQPQPAFQQPPRQQPAAEPGWDEYDQRDARDPEEPPPSRNGSSDRPATGYGPPRNGKQLIAAAHRAGQFELLEKLAKRADRGKIIEWDKALVDWAWDQLARPQPAGRWGRN